MSSEYRIEKDSMGEVKVPQSALYGAQTQRAIDNFKISGDVFPPEFIESLASLKASCAIEIGLGHLGIFNHRSRGR